MVIIKELNGIKPIIGKDCFFAENAVVIGEVTMGDQCSIWYNAVIRGDVHYIKMGNKVNVQDGAVIHATYKVSPTNIGNNVSIGHNALVHGCTIHDNVLLEWVPLLWMIVLLKVIVLLQQVLSLRKVTCSIRISFMQVCRLKKLKDIIRN